MSRGLGVMQRQILESLDPAREAQESYDRGWVLYQRVDMHLTQDVYDLRCVSQYVRRRLNAYEAEQFYPRFSRAVRGLVTRGLLHSLRIVPLDQVKAQHQGRFIPYLSWDGDRPYFHWQSRQIRFVKR